MFVLDRIKEHAQTERTALVNREERLSYRELDAYAEAFAAWLLDLPGNGRAPVVIYGHKETWFLPCIYGALKSGRPYVPVDISAPAERAADIIDDVEPGVIVNFTGHSLRTDTTVLNPRDLQSIFHGGSRGPVGREHWVSGGDTAYLLFTSGSTGRPKGVPITANNLECFYRGLLPYLPEGEGGVILNQISYSFDVSCCSLFAGISRGMTLFTVDRDMVADMGTMFSLLETSGLTLWVSTPSFAELCAGSSRFAREALPRLDRFLFCGEVLSHKLCDTLAERFPKARVLNTYGPTEATVLVTAVPVTGEMRRSSRPIPIGRPLEGVELRIVDSKGAVIGGEEECGELVILGGSVGPGYHHRPNQTAAAFFQEDGKRGYRTGDICYRKDGLYYYAGRGDNQLKLNGYRVELEDIERNLARLDNVARAAVIPVWADGERSRVQFLAAFLLLEGEDGLTPLQRSVKIKREASALLPSYMIPRKITAVSAFPLNINGKVDKRALEQLLAEKAGRP